MIITTFNIHRGFSGKIYQIISDFKNSDIICLQETGIITDQDIIDLETTSDYSMTRSNGPSAASKGVAILHRKSLGTVIEYPNLQLKGQFLHIKYQYHGFNVNIMNVYGPCEYDRKAQFYNQIYDHIQPLFNILDVFVMSGDFNLIESKLDSKSGDLQFQPPLARLNLTKIQADFLLKDCFRHVFPRKKILTFLKGEAGSRLDRIYLSQYHCDTIQDLQHCDSNYSDHKSVTFRVDLRSGRWGRGKWKLNTSILDEPQYIAQITDFWTFWQNQKLNHPDQLAWWEAGKQHIKDISVQYSKCRAQKLKNQLKQLEHQKLDIENNQNLDDYYFGNLHLSLINDIKSIQNTLSRGTLIRSKLPFEQSDESNLDIFRKQELDKGSRKQINKLADGTGTICTEKTEILEIIYHFYKNLYSSDTISEDTITEYLDQTEMTSLSLADRDLIGNTLIDKDEIFTALGEFQNNKSPGIDGIPKEFYITFWPIIQDDLLDTINNIFFRQELTETMKTSVITITYKNKGSKTDLKNYRPISLLTVDYKIIAKVVTNRINKVLNHILLDTQSGAGKDKSIINNLLSIDNIIKYAEQKYLDIAILAYDQEKAFDRLNRDYLMHLLRHLNFPPSILKWITILYKDLRVFCEVRGAFTESFTPERGVKQGCPLSMALYSIAIHPLALNITKNTSIRGIHIPNYPGEVKTIQHADDLTVIITDHNSFPHLDRELNKFQLTSGSKINADKTEILPFGHMAAHMPNHLTPFIKTKIKLLGIYFGPANHHDNWNPILNKIRKKLIKWKNRSLTFREKKHILDTFILSQVWYVGRIVKPNKHTIKEINSAIYSFLWNGKYEAIARDSLQLPLDLGGQNICDIAVKLEAFELQQVAWAARENPHPWVSLLFYWLGPTLGEFNPNRTYPECTMNVHNSYKSLQTNFRKINMKFTAKTKSIEIYLKLLETKNIKTKIQQENIHINFELTFHHLQHCKLKPKQLDFMYLAVHKALPTKQFLRARSSIDFDTKCNYCRIGGETLRHLFVECGHLGRLRESFCNFLRNTLHTRIVIGEFTPYLYNIENRLYPYFYHYFHVIWSHRVKPKPIEIMIDSMLYSLLEITPVM